MMFVLLAALPLLPSLYILGQLLADERQLGASANTVHQATQGNDYAYVHDHNLVGMQLLLFAALGAVGHAVTNRLIPNIRGYMVRRGISGKDLGKKGTALEGADVPEALGIVPGTVFLVCLIFCLVGFATSYPRKVRAGVWCTEQTWQSSCSDLECIDSWHLRACENYE